MGVAGAARLQEPAAKVWRNPRKTQHQKAAFQRAEAAVEQVRLVHRSAMLHYGLF